MEKQELVFKGANNQAVTTSLMVAKEFGKEHKTVIRSIENLIGGTEQNCAVLSMFEKSTYYNSQNKEQPMYLMNRDGFTLLAMSFTGKEALQFKLAYLDAFNKMEQAIKQSSAIANVPQTFSQALMLAAKQQEEIERQQKLLEDNTKTIGAQAEQIHTLTNAVAEMQEKVSYVDRILASKDTVTVTQIAQDYGMSAKAMNKTLADLHIQRKVNKQWILYSNYLPCGYVHAKSVDITRSNGVRDVVLNTEWTQKGRLFLYNTLKEHNYLPLIEQ